MIVVGPPQDEFMSGNVVLVSKISVFVHESFVLPNTKHVQEIIENY